MRIPGPMVGVSSDLAGVVALALIDYMRATRIVDPAVGRLLEELRALDIASGRSPHGSHPAEPPAEWVRIDDDSAAAYGVSKRTLRTYATTNRIPAYREGPEWRIAAPSCSATSRRTTRTDAATPGRPRG